jgi:hypothetical protein
MTIRFLRATACVALVSMASACNMPPGTNGAPAASQAAANGAPAGSFPASTQAPAAPALGGYQLAVISGSANWVSNVVRLNTTTGASVLSADDDSFFPITEAGPAPLGTYRIYSWTTYDSGATTREWDVYRLDTQTGRLWHLEYDGKVTASWAEVVASPPAAQTPIGQPATGQPATGQPATGQPATGQ